MHRGKTVVDLRLCLVVIFEQFLHYYDQRKFRIIRLKIIPPSYLWCAEETVVPSPMLASRVHAREMRTTKPPLAFREGDALMVLMRGRANTNILTEPVSGVTGAKAGAVQ